MTSVCGWNAGRCRWSRLDWHRWGVGSVLLRAIEYATSKLETWDWHREGFYVREGWSKHMTSKAGFASDGVEWAKVLLTACYGGVSF